MITTIVFDFSRVLLFPTDPTYQGELNFFHKENKHTSEYNVLHYFRLNEELLQFANTLTSHYDFYIFTTGTLQDEPEIRKELDQIVKRIYTTSEVGFTKDTSQAYLQIAELIGSKPEEILFIDDTTVNIQAAAKAGLKTIQFHNNKQVFEEIKQYI